MTQSRNSHRFLHFCAAIALLFPSSLRAADAPLADPARLSLQAVQVPGTGFHDAAGFDVMDWNADGLPDLYIHDTGSIAKGTIHHNIGAPGAPRFNPVWYMQPYNCTETFPQTIEHNQSRAFCDLNHDGLPDLILFDGQLRYLPNTGHASGWNLWHLWKGEGEGFFPGTPAMVKENSRFSAGPESMFWDKGIFARQVITLASADMDADGLEDLVICRMTDQQPGVRAYPEVWEQWTPRGRAAHRIPQTLPPYTGPITLAPLPAAPARETVFYRNIGSKSQPKFDKGIFVTTPEGKPVVAPNPVIADVDGDGLLDLVSSETSYSCNAFRVDWPTNPNVVWFKRVTKDTQQFAAPLPLLVNQQTPIPAGTMARLANLRGTGALDLLVMDPQGTIRWYANASSKAALAFESAQTITASEFARYEFMFQPLIVDWFAPNSRDLILHGVTDAHCKWGLRRTTLFKNIATKPGEIRYQRVGDLTFSGDPAIIPYAEQDSPYGVYGSYISVMPDKGLGKRILMSADGKVSLFSGLAPDGLTFTKRTPISLAARRDAFKDWQDFTLPTEIAAKPITHIRIGNSGNAFKMINLLAFQAISGGKNVATLEQGASIANTYPPQTPDYSQVRNGNTMLTPGSQADPKKFNASTFGFFVGPAIIKLANPVKIDRFRLQFSDRPQSWYESFVPFEWQGKTYRMTEEIGQYWAQVLIEVSEDGKTWTPAVDARQIDMSRANPVPVDWNNDGKTDLVVAALGTNESLYPTKLTYRLYLNQGTEEAPVYGQPILATSEKKQPLAPQVPWVAGYSPMAGLKLVDMDADGKLDLVVESPGFTGNQLLWYRNISDQPAGFTFDSTERSFKSDIANFAHNGRYRYFDYADVDGDGIRDVLNAGSMHQRLYLVKGIHPAAPQAITDLAVDSRSATATTVSFTRPSSAEKFDLRFSSAIPDEVNWSTNQSVAGQYTVPPGQRQQVVIPSAQSDSRLYAAVKSTTAAGYASSASAHIDFIPAPANVLLLANGLPDGGGKPYAGCTSVTLIQGKQGELTAPAPQTLGVMPPSANLSTGKPFANTWVTLVRFDALPKSPVASASLRLTVTQGEKDIRVDGAPNISCSQIDIPASATLTDATWQNSQPGTPWPENHLIQGGKFHSFGNVPSAVMATGATHRWDVTHAVNAAIAQGKSSVTLLLRLDYTGHYTGGGITFHAPDAKALAARPALELVLK
jgi:hypothetical protein